MTAMKQLKNFHCVDKTICVTATESKSLDNPFSKPNGSIPKTLSPSDFLQPPKSQIMQYYKPKILLNKSFVTCVWEAFTWKRWLHISAISGWTQDDAMVDAAPKTMKWCHKKAFSFEFSAFSGLSEKA